jgi:hypothetical protein
MEAIRKHRVDTKLLWITLKRIFKRMDGRARSRLLWCRTGISGGLLYMVLKVQGSYTIGDFLLSWENISFSKTLLCGFSYALNSE